MPVDPWTLMGWLLCALIVLLVISAPLVAVWADKRRKRLIAEFEAWQQQQAVRRVERFERFGLPVRSRPGGASATVAENRMSAIEARVQVAEGSIQAINARIDGTASA